MLKAVIFDLDGVICSTDEYHYQAWKAMADFMRIPFDHEINNRLRGVSRMESLEIILEKYEGVPLTNAQKVKLTDQKNQIYVDLLKNMGRDDLSNEVKNTLDTLKNHKYKLAIGSSSKNAPLILERLGLADYFDAVCDGNHIKKSKPDPEVFIKAARYLNEDVDGCLVVEDAVAGVEAGRSGGFLVACLGDASDAQKGNFNMNSFGELVGVCERLKA